MLVKKQRKVINMNDFIPITTVKCLTCGDSIKSSYEGHFIKCECKKVFIDETRYYVRIGGDPENYITKKD